MTWKNRRFSRWMALAAAGAATFGIAGLALADDGSFTCSCSVTLGGDVVITATKTCPAGTYCSCVIHRGPSGGVTGVSAVCRPIPQPVPE